jgi:hypothetical protein
LWHSICDTTGKVCGHFTPVNDDGDTAEAEYELDLIQRKRIYDELLEELGTND